MANINNSDKVPPLYRRGEIRLGVGVALILFLIGGILFARNLAEASLIDEALVPSNAVTVNAVTLRATSQYEIKRKFSGSIVAARESDHGFDKGGLLAKVLVDEGDRVKKGDILARLDMRRLDARQSELDAELARAKALNKEATARMDQARATYERNIILLEKKHISEQRFDQVKFDMIALEAHKVATKAAVTKAKAALGSLRADRALATLTARFDGSVVRRYLDEGSSFGAGKPVIRLIEDQKLEIHTGLPAVAISALTIGDAYKFDSQGGEITTKLRDIHARLDQATRTVTAIFDITGDVANIRAGGLARITINQQLQQDGYWLPISALAESRRGLWSAYSLERVPSGSKNAGNNTKNPLNPNKKLTYTLARQELQLLYTESDRVYVRGTIQDGQKIVTGGIHRLVPGQYVRLAGDK